MTPRRIVMTCIQFCIGMVIGWLLVLLYWR